MVDPKPGIRALLQLDLLREGPFWPAVLRYRAWLERRRKRNPLWFRAYESVASRLVRVLPPPEQMAPLPADTPAKRFRGRDALAWKRIFQNLNRGTERAATPAMSILTPGWNTKPGWFTEAAVSVLDQKFTDWEWIFVDDGSPERRYHPYARALADVCPRFRFEVLPRNLGISGATNAALRLARGEFVCMLDHDDLLHPEALELCMEKLASGGYDAVYTDSNKVSEDGIFSEPFYKPDWSPEYFRGVMFVGHLLCVRRELAIRSGGFSSEFNGIQDYEFLLRFSERSQRIGHVPRILYHWRTAEGSIASAHDAKGSRIGQLQLRAVNGHLERLGLAAKATPGAAPHRVTIIPKPRQSNPLVSVIIPTRDAGEVLTKCLDSIRDLSTYRNLQVICSDHDTTDPVALARMAAPDVERIHYSGVFNYARINNLAVREAAKGEYLVLLNNDVEVITPEWIEELLYHAEQPDAGAVGALLLYPNGKVQHAGVVIGFRGTADHVLRGGDPDSDGYAGSLSCAREVSAVTAACMMVKRSLYEAAGGLNEYYRTLYQDVEFCLRLRELGKRNIFVPRARLFHHESYSRKTDYDMVDRALFLDAWEEWAGKDPFYNPNFSLANVDYSVSEQADTGKLPAAFP